MEHYIVSARKYRPSKFSDVVGQQAITNTLENAIASNHLAQALLFTGPRGVGKTTCARILAKRINQEDGLDNPDEDFAFNIFELDAASNNSVDDIRNLIDQVRIPPQIGKYKVYIIDEVHMLSSAAFNAFLKTLEEPPKHAIFILATTEKHKIIPTILSRCQIFDFKRITVLDIKNHLKTVAQKEGIEADDDALHIIAQKADGALRDALSIFDRIVSFSGTKITRKDVTENLNVLDYTYYFTITDLLLKNEIPALLLNYNDIISKGFDGHHFIMGLASHFRDLLVAKNKETIALLEVGNGVQELYLKQSEKTSSTFLLEAINLANDCDLKYKSSRNQRLLVELTLLNIASLTFEAEKKKSKNFIISASYIRSKSQPAGPDSDRKSAVTDSNSSIMQTTAPAAEPTPIAFQEKKQVPISNTINSSSKPITKTKISALSIKSIQKKQALQNEIQSKLKPSKEKLAHTFTEEEMLVVWEKYAQKIKKKGKFNLYSHLSMCTPKLKENQICITYPNNTIKIEVEREQGALISFLQKHLKNNFITLAISVNEKEQKKYVYTAIEKFEKLNQINPNLDLLRKTFDLDL
jgi:DNA polymerase-3 subunit gamma/tau